MTKNQKIAAGCGGLGCLGLIVLAIAGGLGYYFYYAQRPVERVYGINVNVNSNANSNSNDSGNRNSNANSTSENSSSDKSSSYSDDEKHKLYQAASMSGDADLMQKVSKKLGLFTASGIPGDEYPQFIKDHGTWAISNAAFIASLDTPEKARAYVDAHL